MILLRFQEDHRLVWCQVNQTRHGLPNHTTSLDISTQLTASTLVILVHKLLKLRFQRTL